MKTILVTGGAGFVGSHLVDRLLAENCYVISVDNFNDFYPPRFKHQNIVRHLNNPHFTLIKADITDKKAMERVFKRRKIDNIIHLAARAGIRSSIINPRLYQETNVIGTTNLLQLAQKQQVNHFICTSSSSVYGKSNPPFSEDDPCSTPLSPYAASKRAAELICYVYHHLYNLNITILRLFSVYGPRGRPDMVPYLFTKAVLEGKPIIQFGDGSSARDWTYVDDIVEGIIKALEKPFPFEIINLGNNQPITLRVLIREIERAVNKKAKIIKKPNQPGEMRKTWARIKKAKELLNWQPRVGFSKGINLFVDWFKASRLVAN